MLFSIFPFRAEWEFLCGSMEQNPTLLCLDECGQAASGAFAKLAISQFIGERFQVGHAVNRKILKLRIGRVQVQRGLTQEAASDGFSQLEMIDAEQFQRFLNFGKQTAFELDSLRGDSVVDTPAFGVEDEADESAGHQEKQAQIQDVRIGSFDISGFHGVSGSRGESDDDKERQELAYGIDECRMTNEQIALGLDIFGSSELRQVRVAEPALDCDGLDGLSAERTRFAVWVQDSLLSRLAPIQIRIPTPGEADEKCYAGSMSALSTAAWEGSSSDTGFSSAPAPMARGKGLGGWRGTL